MRWGVHVIQGLLLAVALVATELAVAGSIDRGAEVSTNKATSAVATSAPVQHVVLVTGIPGEPFYAKRFARIADNVRQVSLRGLGVREPNFHYLGASEPGVSQSTKDNVLARLADLAATSHRDDTVMLLLVGHASARGKRLALNLPGPDLLAEDLNTALAAVASTRMVVVVATASSGAFLPVLSAPGRVVVTATASADENQYPVFVDPFVAAFAERQADFDKNGRVSLVEAFNYAQLGVKERYQQQQLLVVEHALLDDNGDGNGTRAPIADVSAGDGRIAATLFFNRPDVSVAEQAARLPLRIAANILVERIATLKREKEKYFPKAFYQRLEALLVELALNRRVYRAASTGQVQVQAVDPRPSQGQAKP